MSKPKNCQMCGVLLTSKNRYDYVDELGGYCNSCG